MYGDHTHLSVTQYDDLNCMIFMKFSRGILYRKLSSELFHGHNASQDVNDFLSVTIIFVYIFYRLKFDHISLSVTCYSNLLTFHKFAAVTAII